jgi:hypothetical protein
MFLMLFGPFYDGVLANSEMARILNKAGSGLMKTWL